MNDQDQKHLSDLADGGPDRRHAHQDGGQRVADDLLLGQVQHRGGQVRSALGAFEYAVLRAIEVLGLTAYGAEIGRRLSQELGRDVTAPQVYMTLSRLTKRGFVSFVDTDPVPERGGRSKKRFNLEAGGIRALRETSAVFATSSPEVNYAATGELTA